MGRDSRKPQTSAWVGVLVLAFLWGCDPVKETGVPYISNQATYRTTLDEVRKLTEEPLAKHDQAIPLNEDEKEGLNKATDLLTGLAQFNPTEFTLYYLKGRALRATGNDVDAELALAQGASLTPRDASPGDQLVLSEINAELGEIYLNKQDHNAALKAAALAHQFAPKSPSGLILAARVHIEEKDLEMAKKELEKAYEIDPDHPETKGLIELIKMAEREKKANPPE